MTTRRVLRVVQIVLVVAGTMALGYWAMVWTHAEVFQVIEARRFAAALRTRAVPAPPAPSSFVRSPMPSPRDGEDLGKLEIPRLGLSVMVVQGVSTADLRRAAGHIPGTAFPWQPGNVGIAGHRDTFFRCLRLIRPNDAITLATLQGVYRYRVVFTKVVSPSDVQVLAPTEGGTLTLVTCFPFYYVGSAPRRVIVRAAKG
jgi:sortase A